MYGVTLVNSKQGSKKNQLKFMALSLQYISESNETDRVGEEWRAEEIYR